MGNRRDGRSSRQGISSEAVRMSVSPAAAEEELLDWKLEVEETLGGGGGG